MELEQIGKYKIIAKIGQGAMGEVWKAHDPVLNRHVAIKTMSAGVGADETLRKRFHREAQSAARLNHPNIITVYDYGEEKGQIFMAMELLEGSDLKEIIAKGALNDLFDKLDVMEQICDGLGYAHANEVIHRDLKPGNIHLQAGGQVKIMDFGLARLGASADMTKSGMILGTPNYMSPEQVRGEKADARSDIFSLGSVFYELLTNRKPFDADSLHAVLFNVLQQEPEPVRKWVPDVPGPLVDVVEKALSKDAGERFPDAAAMRETLRAVRKALAEGWVGDPTIAEPAARLAEETAGAEPLTKPAPRSLAARRSTLEVEGTAALDSKQSAVLQSASGISGARTLSGRAPTHAEGSLAASGSRAPLYIGGAIGLAGLGVVTFMLLRPAPKPAGAPTEQTTALTRALVGTQIELARRNLQDKDFKGAIAQAEGALKLDPKSAEAREIIVQANTTLQELDRGAAEARTALEAGDAEKASKELARVLALDPKNPLATELSQRLGDRFRGQAEEARKAMARSRGGAEKAKAATSDSFAEAAALGREAEASFQKGDFTGSAQKFLGARDAYDRARRVAEEASARPTLPPTTTPPATVPATTLAPATPPPLTAPPATAAPVSVPPPTAPPLTAAPAAAPPSDELLVRKVVADYGRAIETRDLALFRSIKPSLTSDEERRLREAFQGIQSQQVNITVQSVQLTGAQATVRLSRRDVIAGSPVSAFQQTLILVKGPAGWTIKEIGR